ncbi:glycosyltransferase involved in cell wall biosynthesis [Nocardioides thalensis]|uniref:Glycosyltransferase involved in cell wall biosynthesis n=1 Tax=Nocardioides thalensis TaxID=1914755 RepID=A0A853C6I4_9ACTN|nr:glycosyltransferase involved in cell wall biosynthesis [Nocardioides thalensis]
MTRVLHVTQAVGAGVESAITQYVRSTPDLDHSVLALRRDDRERVGGNGDLSWTYADRPLTFARMVRSAGRDADVVHLHSSVAGAVGRVAVDRVGARVVYTPHALAHLGGDRRGRAAFRFVERMLVSRAAAFGAVSDHEAEELVSLGADPAGVLVLPHAVEPGGVARSFDERADRAVAVGRVAWQKDPGLFAAIAGEAIGRGIQSAWRWVGAGDPDSEAALAAAGVGVTGWRGSAEVRDLVGSSRIMVHTAHYEGLPISVLESMAAGTPVVARRIPSLRGLPISTFTTLEEALAHVRRLSDPGVWQTESTAVREFVCSSYNATRQAAALRALYEVAS